MISASESIVFDLENILAPSDFSFEANLRNAPILPLDWAVSLAMMVICSDFATSVMAALRLLQERHHVHRMKQISRWSIATKSQHRGEEMNILGHMILCVGQVVHFGE